MNVNILGQRSELPKTVAGTHVLGRVIFCVLMVLLVQGCRGGDSKDTQQDDQNTGLIGNDGPEGDSAITVNGINYPLDAALGNQWGPDDTHYQLDFTLSNGNFRIESVEIDGVRFDLLVPANNTAVFFASMFSPGDSFNFANYAFADDVSDEAVSGVSYFTDGYVGVDVNLNEVVDRDEKFDIINGTVSFTGVLPDISLQFSVTLSNGQLVTGEYTGLFEFTRRY